MVMPGGGVLKLMLMGWVKPLAVETKTLRNVVTFELLVNVTVFEPGELNSEKGKEVELLKFNKMVEVCTGTPAAVPVTVTLATPKLAKALPAGTKLKVKNWVLPGFIVAVVGETVTPAGSGPNVSVTGVANPETPSAAVMPMTTLELASNVSGPEGLLNCDRVNGGAPW
jgi:hypothetical protein